MLLIAQIAQCSALLTYIIGRYTHASNREKRNKNSKKNLRARYAVAYKLLFTSLLGAVPSLLSDYLLTYSLTSCEYLCTVTVIVAHSAQCTALFVVVCYILLLPSGAEDVVG